MNSQKDLLKTFSKYIYPYLKEEIILFSLMIVSSAGSLVTPYMLKIIIDDVFPKGSFHDLAILLIILVGIYVLQIISSLISDVISTKVSKKISSDIREDAFLNILKKDMSFFKESKVGELVFTLMTDVENIQQTISSLLIRSIKNLIVLIGVIVMLFILDYRLAIMSLLFLPVIVLVIRAFTPQVKNNFKDIQTMEASLNNYLVERINNIKVIKSYNTLQEETKNIEQHHKHLIVQHSKSTFLSSLNNGVTSLLMSLAPILVLSFGGYQVFQNAMSVGVLIAFIQYLNRLFTPTLEIANSYNQFSKALISMKRVSEYFTTDGVEIEKDRDKRKEITEISFNNVALNQGVTKILKGVNLKFERGKTYILTGKSGSGKSSIINLLCGFIQPTTGNVLINHDKIENCSYWNNEYCLVEKENQLFHGTIEYNIRYGTENGNFKINDILAYSHLHDVIRKMKNGIDSILPIGGGSLSDGQKQRVSIARAINKSPSVFIFDESTASLDVALEYEIITKIRQIFPEAIIIIVSHRTECLSFADSVFNIERGVITQESPLSKAI